MTFKAILIDFDGTLTSVDVLERLALSVGKEVESREIVAAYQAGLIDGPTCLVRRVDLIAGMKVSRIQELLDESFLRPGFGVLRSWLRNSSLRSILVSGNLCPVVEYYQVMLGVERAFCSRPTIRNGRVVRLESDDIGKRLPVVQRYLTEIGILMDEVIAVGDDISDVPFFEACGWSIAFNSKANVSSHARQAVSGDLTSLVRALVSSQ